MVSIVEVPQYQPDAGVTQHCRPLLREWSRSISGSQASIRIPEAETDVRKDFGLRSKPNFLQLVGNTPVLEIEELSDFFNLKSLLVKDESFNPFGTHKDRKSHYVVQTAIRESIRPEALCILTAGNAGLSLAAFAAGESLPVTAVIDASNTTARSSLEQVCEQVHQVDLMRKRWSRKELQTMAGAACGRRVRDVTNLIVPYHSLAMEIILYRPDVIVVPVGGGELFLGLVAGLRDAGLKTRLIGVTVRRSTSSADKLYALWTPHRDRINKLTLPSSRHSLYYMDDESTLSETCRKVRQHLRCEPSSATAFDALRHISLRADERVLVINTGTFKQEIDARIELRSG